MIIKFYLSIAGNLVDIAQADPVRRGLCHYRANGVPRRCNGGCGVVKRDVCYTHNAFVDMSTKMGASYQLLA